MQDNEHVFKPCNFPNFVLSDDVSMLNKGNFSHNLAVTLLVAPVYPEISTEGGTAQYFCCYATCSMDSNAVSSVLQYHHKALW